MEKFLKLLKIETLGGLIIRFSLAGLLLFGGFSKFTLIGAEGYSLQGAILMAAIETISSFGILYHFKNPIMGIIGGLLALVSVIIRFVFTLYWLRTEIGSINSLFESFNIMTLVFNNGMFHIFLLIGASIYCTGNSYKHYITNRLTQPWPK
ncbi:hypothetical protein [Anditalea andensis]|uniref:DoxX family protein n=1 Tax=Anditalea andensis TaxID=1048983 RepID=A0A074KYQ6_9BACT|nr:hypothetical protein [Anditalea andensis]KEO72753.1 hypothetical protein EL17_14035 [Anditalea andensis]